MSADPPQPIDPNFRLELPGFEGPLDLLLYLIQKHELDILDLPISFVAGKYVEYLSLMQKLNLDVASEYLVMAATLAHIKSKSLLPTPPIDQDDDPEDELDPRAELIKRLLEYQKYRKAAADLGARGVAGRDVFPRGIAAPEAQGPGDLAETSVFKLLDAFQKVLLRAKADLSFEVSAERITITERIAEITDELKSRRRCGFEELFAGVTSTYDIVVTFLALLEMAKMNMMRIYQAEPDAPIHIEYRVLDVSEGREGDEVSEGFESVDSFSSDGAGDEADEEHEELNDFDNLGEEAETHEEPEPSAAPDSPDDVEVESEPDSEHDGDPTEPGVDG